MIFSFFDLLFTYFYADREKIKIMTEENAQLQFEKKSNMNESTNLEQELESARLKIAGNSSFTIQTIW
jgi:hypothetical protein